MCTRRYFRLVFAVEGVLAAPYTLLRPGDQGNVSELRCRQRGRRKQTSYRVLLGHLSGLEEELHDGNDGREGQSS